MPPTMDERKSPKLKTAFTASEVNVLLEDIKSDFRAVTDGLSTLTNRGAALEANQAATLERATLMELSMRKIKNDIVIIKEDITSVINDIVEIRTDIKEIKSGLSSHERRIIQIETTR